MRRCGTELWLVWEAGSKRNPDATHNRGSSNEHEKKRRQGTCIESQETQGNEIDNGKNEWTYAVGVDHVQVDARILVRDLA